MKITGTNSLVGGEFNLKDTPDLLPVLSILALKCKNPIKITGISHARYKETDRVANISSQLVKFGADVKEETDSLYIKPPIKIKNASLILLMIIGFLWLFSLLLYLQRNLR